MIKRPRSTFYAYLIFLCVLVSGAWAVKKTNFVFIYADDLGFGDLACYGHPYAKTPALDKLAREGTRFTQAYAGGQTSNPAARFEKFQKAEAILLDEMPVIPIYFYVSLTLVKPNVRGWYPNILDHHPYKYIHLE